MECLAVEALARGIALIPPRATTVGQVVDILFPPERARASREAQVRSLAVALLEMGARALEPAFPHLTDETLHARRDGLARLLADLSADLAQEGHDFRDVARIAGAWDAFQDSARWETLASVAERASALLAEAGLEDPWEARRHLIDATPAPSAVSTGTVTEVWLVGLAELPGVTRRLLDASGATLRAIIHGVPDGGGGSTGASPDVPSPFDTWGIPHPDFWSRAPIPLKDSQIHAADRPADQAEAVVRILAAIDPSPHVDEVLVAVGQGSDVLPYLDHQLSNHGIRTRLGSGTALSSTEPFRLLQIAAELLETGRWASMAALLRHPAAPGLLEAAGIRGDLAMAPEWADAWFNHHLPYRVDGTLPVEDPAADPRGSEQRAPFGTLVRALQKEGPMAAFAGPDAPLSTWMPRAMELLLAAYGSFPFGQDRTSDRQLLRALDAVRDGAEALRALPGPLDEPVSGADALRVLLESIRGQAVPVEADPQAVELVDWLEVVVDDAPVVIVSGFNEGKIPASQVGDPLLPDRLRSHLGLPDNTRRLGRDAYRLTALLHRCPSVHVIPGRTSAAGDPLRPSRLLFQTDPETAARRVRAFFEPGRGGAGRGGPGRGIGGESSGEDERPMPALLRRHVQPSTHSAFTVPPEPVIQVEPADLPDHLAVTQFRALLADPYRFALASIRHLDTIGDDAREMDGLIYGSLAHTVLEAFGRQALAHPEWPLLQDAAALGAHLVDLLRQRARKQFGANPLPAVRLQCLQLEGRLRAFARAQVAWGSEGWLIRSVEGRLEDGKYPFPVDGEPFFLRGRIDRIDHNPETGTWAILDYKTSANVTPPEKAHRRQTEWIDLQLPLYRHLALGIRDADGQPVLPGDAVARGAVRVGYVAIPQDPAETAFLLADWGEADLAAADARARDAIRILRGGTFRFDPIRTARLGFKDDPLAPLMSAGWSPDEGDDTEETP